MTDKRFPPSAQKIAKARREGRLVTSRWFAVAISIFVAAIVGQRTVSLVRERTLLHYTEWADVHPRELLVMAGYTAIQGSAYMLLSIAFVAVGVHLLQTKGAVSFERLATAAREVGPRSLMGRLRSSAREVPAGVFRAAVVLAVAYPAARDVVTVAGNVAGVERVDALTVLAQVSSTLLVRECGVLLLFGVGAYFVARRRFFKDLSMSMEELRQELRDDNGDPHMKSHRKADAQALSLADLERRVKRSKVVIVQRKRA
jgi:flagellar biosynthesis protein FlhB